LDEGPAAGETVQSGLDAGGRARGVDCYGCAVGEEGGGGEDGVGLGFGGGLLVGIDECGVGGGVGFCEGESFGEDVDGDDGGGAEGAGDGAAEEADGAGAEDYYAAAGVNAGEFGDVDGDGEGFD
jgi:hypothetical protein